MNHRRIKGMGWIPDLPDHRDRRWSIIARPDAIDPFTDLTTYEANGKVCMPGVYDQLPLGACTGNGIAGGCEYAINRQGLPPLGPSGTPSRLMIYYDERAIEGTIDTDSGASIRDGIKSVAQQGVCDESEWPYDITKFTDRPPDSCYADAAHHIVQQYAAVPQTHDGLRGTLTKGYVVVFGFTVYESFESAAVAQTGVVPMPSKDEGVLGGHCVVLVGHNDAKRLYKFRNSWGSGWGDEGYGYMPYEYVENPDLASDFWVIELLMPPAA